MDSSSIDNFNRMISKNPEKRFAKNYNFVFGEDYTNDSDFKNAVNNFINNNKNVYDSIYQKVMNADTGTTKESMIAYSNMLNFISEKENISIQDIQSKMLKLAGDQKEKLLESFSSNKEAFDSLDLDSSVWNKPVITKTREELLREKQQNIKKLQERLKKINPVDSEFEKLPLEEKHKRIKEKNEANAKNRKETLRNMKNRNNQYVISKNVKESHAEELKKHINDIDNKISSLKIIDRNHPDIKNLEIQRESLRDSLRVTEGGLFTTSQPKLNPPKEGAPMFEENVVPSNIADTDAFNKMLESDASKIRNEINYTGTNKKSKQHFKRGEGQYRVKQIESIEYTDLDATDSLDINTEYNISDLSPETLANLTDEEIIEWATNNEELNQAIDLRTQARKDLGMDDVPEIETTGRNTEINTQLNNNFNGGKPNIDTSNDDKVIKEKIKRFTEEERKRFEKQSQMDFDKKMKEIEEEFDQEVERIEKEFGPNKDNFVEPEVETSSANKSSQELPETNTSTDNSRPVDAPKTRSRKQRIEDAGKRLGNNKGPNGSRKRFTGQRVANNSKRSIKKRKLQGKFKVKKGNLKEVVANTVVSKVVGEATEAVEETVQRLNPNFLNSLDDFADLTDDDIAYFADQISDRKQRKASIEKWERNRERAKKERKNKQIIDDFENGKLDYDPENPYGNRIRHNLNEKLAEEVAEETLGSNKVDDVFGWMKKHKIGVLDVGFNLFSSIGDYKDSRRKGHGVVSSAARAVGSFAVGEMLGFWGGMGVTAFKLAGTGIVKGTELLYKENRRMNSAANNSVFGAAEFQDTQQLATMRQSGMEMAKMAQYNLQQTLMGNEATYLHR